MIFNWINIFYTEENMILCIVNTNKNVRSSEWEKSWKRTLWKLLLTIVEVIIKVKQKIVFRPKVSWQHFFETIVADIWSTVSVWRWHSSFLVHRYLTIVLLLFFLKKKAKLHLQAKITLWGPSDLATLKWGAHNLLKLQEAIVILPFVIFRASKMCQWISEGEVLSGYIQDEANFETFQIKHLSQLQRVSAFFNQNQRHLVWLQKSQRAHTKCVKEDVI